MSHFLDLLMLTFIPLFVALDPVGVIPIYIGLTARMEPKERRRVNLEALTTALGVTILFFFGGKLIFAILHITQYDFQVAGGGLLLVLAVIDIVQSGKERRQPPHGTGVGVVPLGMPLIVGPAVLTTMLILSDLYPTSVGRAALGVSVLLNIGLVVLLFTQAARLAHLIGTGGMMAVSKLFGLLLAALGVMMVRKGIEGMLGVLQ